MFVSRNSLSGKPLSKFSCVCLPLGKLVNGKHFSVNGKHFPVNGNTFRSTENTFRSTETLFGQRKTLSSQRKHFSVNGNTFRIWFGFQESVFPFGCVCFSESDFRETTFQTFLCLFAIRKVGQRKTLSKLSCVCLPLEKLVNGKHFPVKGKSGLVFRKVFSWKIWAENTFQKLWKI